MNQHGEPMRIERDENGLAEIVGADGRPYCRVFGSSVHGKSVPALRIVLCLNACAGMTNAQLAQLSDDDAVARMTREAVADVVDQSRERQGPMRRGEMN